MNKIAMENLEFVGIKIESYSLSFSTFSFPFRCFFVPFQENNSKAVLNTAMDASFPISSHVGAMAVANISAASKGSKATVSALPKFMLIV
jgi:hypothetical protein